MSDYLGYASVGILAIIIVEAAIWMNACLGLSMKDKEMDFTHLMVRAPYRMLWPPKLLVGVLEVVLFTVAAKYYTAGGKEIALAVTVFAVLVVFGALVFWESVRAVRRYEHRG